MQGIATFAMGLQSLKGAWDAATDPDLSGFEKATSVLMSLGMAIPSIVDGVGQIGKGFSGAKKAVSETISTLTASTMAIMAESEAQEENNEEKMKASYWDGRKNGEAIKSIFYTAAKTQGEKAAAA
jgi:hypothetical protein